MQEAQRQSTRLLQVIQDVGVGKGDIHIFSRTVTKFSGQARNSSSSRIPKTIGQLSGHTEIVIQIPKWQEPVGAETVFLPTKTSAPEANAKMWPLGSPPFGRDVDNASQRISTKHRCGPGKDFYALDVLDRGSSRS